MSRIPPQAVEIEESVLGAMLTDSSVVDTVFENLVTGDFYRPIHQNIYDAMIALQLNGEPIDIITVEQTMRDKGIEFESVTLSDLTRSSGSSANTGYQCRIIKEKAIKRNLIQKLNDSVEECYDNQEDTFDVIDRVQERVFSVTEFQEGSLHDINDTLQSLSKHITDLQERGQPLGLRTGLDIDSVLQGFQKGKLYVVGARPSMGKTALVMTIMRKLAKDDFKTGILSLETTHLTLGYRLLSQVSGISVEDLTSGKMNGGQIERVDNAFTELAGHGIYIDDSASVTGQQLRSKCRLMARKGVSIIFIDFLTLIKTEGRSKHEEVGEVMKVAKRVSKELNIPIVMLAQLSRKVEERSEKIPLLSDLRESGSIEEDADCIMFLYRPEYYGISVDKDGNSTAGLAQVIIAKNKDGRTGTKDLLFEKETMQFKNLDFQHKHI